MNHTQMTLDEIAQIANRADDTKITFEISCRNKTEYTTILLTICTDPTINYQADNYGVVSTLVRTNHQNLMVRVHYYRGFQTDNVLVEREITVGRHPSNVVVEANDIKGIRDKVPLKVITGR